MKAKEFNSLSKEQQELEKERCNSFEYFYNNYCKKEGMPDFSQKVWEEYVEFNNKQRFSRRRMDGSYFYPFTPEESFKNTNNCPCCEGIGLVDGEHIEDKESCLTCNGRGKL